MEPRTSKPVTKKTAAKKKPAKKSVKKAVKKTAKKVAKKISKKTVTKKAHAPKRTTHQAMARAKKLVDRLHEDTAYGGGTSFTAATGHPTPYSEAHNDIHIPAPRARDKKARIDMLVGKSIHGHVAAQVRRSQARRDHRG